MSDQMNLLEVNEPKVPVYLGEPEVHTQAELEAKALKFLKENKPKEYKSMKPREVNEYCQLKAENTKRLAENMIATGEPDFVAWPRAIRQVILETESD